MSIAEKLEKKKRKRIDNGPGYYMYYVTLFKQRLLFPLLHDFTFHCCWDTVRAILFILFSFDGISLVACTRRCEKVDRRLEHEQHWKPVARLVNVLAAFYNRWILTFNGQLTCQNVHETQKHSQRYMKPPKMVSTCRKLLSVLFIFDIISHLNLK